jgi:DNA invertase Pin-like site-specific DNA recombinase
MIRQRVHAGLARARAEGKRLGRPTISAESEAAIRDRLATGAGINKVARELGLANGTVHKVKRAMAQSVAAYP